MTEKIEKLYIHCSASRHGNENLINHWHKLRRFMTMWNGYQISTGYNLVILNGNPHDIEHHYPYLDGSIETARPDWLVEAAVKGDNRNTVHVCLIGEAGNFSSAQIDSLYTICQHYIRGGLDVANIWGHYEYWVAKGEQPRKTCPGMNMMKFRNDLTAYMERGTSSEHMAIKIKTRKDVAGRLLDFVNLLLGGVGGQA